MDTAVYLFTLTHRYVVLLVANQVFSRRSVSTKPSELKPMGILTSSYMGCEVRIFAMLLLTLASYIAVKIDRQLNDVNKLFRLFKQFILYYYSYCLFTTFSTLNTPGDVLSRTLVLCILLYITTFKRYICCLCPNIINFWSIM